MNDIEMNPPGTTGRNCLQVNIQGSFYVFDSIRGALYLANRSVFTWHDAEISENPGCYIIFKNSGRNIFFEVEKYGCKNSNLSDSNHADSNHSDLIPSDSKNIKPKNQHDLDKYCLLHKIMSWNSHDSQANTNDTTAQSSTFSTRTMPCNLLT